MSDWLCIDEDSPELEEYIAGAVAQAVAEFSPLLDGDGVRADDPRRAAKLAELAKLIETHSHNVVANARAQAAFGEARSELH